MKHYKKAGRVFWCHLAETAVLGALLLCVGAVRGHRVCTQHDITRIPDTSFQSYAAPAAADANGTGQKIVCLTFDDGPSSTTPLVLETLRQKQVLATFFVMAADNNRKYLPLIQTEADNGHQIALHTASHEYKKIYQSPESYWQDITELLQAISPYTDTEKIRYLRFPGGSTNTVSRKYGGSDIMKRLKAQAQEKGYRYIDWNVCAEDAAGGHPSAEEIYRNILREAQNQTVCVVLMHDTAATKNTAKALPDVIDWFREQGYRFCTVEQMDQLCTQSPPNS